MRVALVHDWLVTMGGAERVLEEISTLFPDAPIYTGVVNRSRLSPFLRQRTIIPSFVQALPYAVRWYNRYLPFLMYGMEQFDLSSYDLVISSSSAVAKGVLTPAGTCHVSYVHSPMRYAWDLYHEYRDREAKGITRHIMGPVFHYLRMWDRLSADRVDVMLTNSTAVKRRIQKHYRRDAEVIFPPVAVERFQVSPEPGSYYLVLSRLVPYKRFDLAVEAANRLKIPLIVAGEGPARGSLEKMAGPTVKFLGWVSDDQAARLLSEAKALIFPGEEDFGIIPVEAQASGRPVIAFGRGGVLDSVVHQETGWLFEEQTVDALVKAIEEARDYHWDPARIRENAERFRGDIFRERFQAAILAALTKLR